MQRFTLITASLLLAACSSSPMSSDPDIRFNKRAVSHNAAASVPLVKKSGAVLTFGCFQQSSTKHPFLNTDLNLKRAC